MKTQEVVKLLISILEAFGLEFSISDLVDGMIKLKLVDKDKTHVSSLFFIWVDWLMERHFTVLIPLFLFLLESQLSADHSVERDLSKWNFAAWQNVHHVELERLGALKSNWKNLEPSHSVNFLDHLSEMGPVD